MRGRGSTFAVTLDAYSIRISWSKHNMVEGVIRWGLLGFRVQGLGFRVLDFIVS